MRVCCAIVLFAAGLVFAAGAPSSPARTDDKPKADPPVNAKDKDDKDRELHVVGIYEGFTKTDGKLHGGKARVLLDRPKKSVTLVLVSHTPVTWEVGVGKDTKLDKVILGGGGKSAVKGLPEKVEVVEAFRGSKTPTLPFYAYTLDAPGFRPLVDALAESTGQKKLASFTGLYRANADGLFEVTDVQADDRLSADYPLPAPADKLPKLSFLANYGVPGNLPHEMSRSFGEFTLTGPNRDSLKPLPDHVSRVTYDPAGKKHYGIFRHKLAEIDMEKKKVKEIDTGLDVPEISWPANVSFDTKRGRVLLTTSGGGGILYAYTPKTEKWEALTEKPPWLVTYHPKNDTLYGLKGDVFGRGMPELQELNAEGAVVESTKLDGPFLPGMFSVGPGVVGMQLIAADDKLVLLISPGENRGGSEAPPSKLTYTYLIDPATGKAQLVHKGKVGK